MKPTNQSHIDCMGYQVFNGALEQEINSKKLLINTINQYSYCIAENDPEFKEALINSDILLPDGIGIVVAAQFLHGKKIKKIAGADLHDFLLHKLNLEKGSCFYLGSSVETLQKIKSRLSKENPNIKVGFFSPPFKSEFSEEDNIQMINSVNAFSPDVLFVGMTAPKQEKWGTANKDFLNTSTVCSIGAVFDFYAGTMKRPNKIWIDLGLEWLGRLLKEPKRMWKRYIYYGAIFTFYLMKQKWQLLFAKKNK